MCAFVSFCGVYPDDNTNHWSLLLMPLTVSPLAGLQQPHKRQQDSKRPTHAP